MLRFFVKIFHMRPGLDARRRVVIVQRRLTHYRVPLFELLREQLAAKGIRLDLLVGRPRDSEGTRADSGRIPWATTVPTEYFLRERLCWQPIYRYLPGIDLAVVTQENALLVNHLLLLAPRRYKLAFWGHGANLQSGNQDSYEERYKRWTTRHVDWWFAYTKLSVDLVAATGFPRSRITLLNNAVDTAELRQQWESITLDESIALRKSLGFSPGPIGVWVGSLYPEKRLDFLFGTAEAIHCHNHSFQLLIIGDGVERDKVRSWTKMRPWAKWVGARFGREKAAYLSVGQVMLNPGGVGLGVFDAFVCGLPMLTTNCGLHGPEISYLENGVNGIVAPNDQLAYAAEVLRLLYDPGALKDLRAECLRSAREYTIENMASRFADGITSAMG